MAEEDFGSLFEGMVLITPSSISQFENLEDSNNQKDSTITSPSPSKPPSLSPPTETSTSSQALDENLFSDLTLNPVRPIDPEPLKSNGHESSTTRQAPRKKKRGIRIGYARESSALDYSAPPNSSESYSRSSSSISFHDLSTVNSLDIDQLDKFSTENSIENSLDSDRLSEAIDYQEIRALDDDSLNHASTSLNDSRNQLSFTPVHSSFAEDKPVDANDKVLDSKEKGVFDDQAIGEPEEFSSKKECVTENSKPGDVSAMEKLESIKGTISDKLERMRAMAASVSASRKEVVRKRREAAEEVHLASMKYKEMETELEEACESEDFERAERVSESLAAAEKAKEAALTSLREAEAECDSVDLRMQEVLESQVAAEEEGVLLLQQFAKDASENADIIMKDAEELSSKEMEEWLSKMECLEMKKMELDLESHLIDEARSGLSNSIDQLTEIDRKEKELLQQKRNSLLKDLENLLELVRLKEAEIAKNNSHIQEVDRRIVNVVSEFHVSHPKINVKYDELQSSLSELSSQSEVLTKKKKEVDDFLCLAEENRLKLSEIASMAAGEARACEELVGLRKALASSILKSRDDKLRLAKTEEKISEEIQLLRQEVSAARASLQELSSSRASIQQEITSSNQRLSFVDQRIPDLEAEKKVAATARNFKEAGRISAESKALSLERETIQARVEEASSELDKMEEEIQNTIEKLHEKEVLVLSKEREAAMSRCERLRLVAASSMVERETALELGDIEEAESLFAEAKAADSEASELLQTFNLEGEKFEKVSKHLVSMAVITSLAGKQLAEKAISIQPSLSS